MGASVWDPTTPVLSPGVYADLASTASGKGAALVGIDAALNYTAGTVGAYFQDEEVNLLWFFTDAERQDVSTGAATIDVAAKINAVFAFANLLRRKSVFWPSGMYRCQAPIVVPPYVGIRGETLGWPAPTFDPAGAWRFGPVIFKAHTGNGVTKTGLGPYDTAAPIINLSISSSRTLYPGGNGFVIDKTGTFDLVRCMVFGVGGDGFVIGTSASDVTGHTRLDRCYVNNCTGVAYRLRSKWGELLTCLSDGCTHGMWAVDSPETKIVDSHFEGFSVAGVRFTGGCGSSKFVGKTFIANTAGALQGVVIDDTPGNSVIGLENVKLQGPSFGAGAITFTAALSAATSGTLTAPWAGTTRSYAVYFSDGSVRTATLTSGITAVTWTGAVTAAAAANTMTTPGSIAIDLKGTAALATGLVGCEVNNWCIGLNDNGTSRTRVRDCEFFECGLPILANSVNTLYSGNVCEATVGAFDIDHVGNGGGVWKDNRVPKGIKPTESGALGNYGTNLVLDNKGWKTRTHGATGLIASGTAVPHGLAAGIVPADTAITVLFGTYANLTVSAVNATNITVSWTGGANLQYQWQARAACELQT